MKKKIIITLILFLCIGGIIFTFTRVKADSGWDTDYDSDWGSDSGWSTSHDRKSSHGGNSGGSLIKNGYAKLAISVLFISVFVVIFIYDRRKNRRTQVIYKALNKDEFNMEEFKQLLSQNGVSFDSDGTRQFTYSDVSDNLLEKYGINKEEFKQIVYQKYVNIQNDWMNFNYDGLKNELTDELYNSYVMQLDILKTKKQKNIMHDFENVDVRIIDISDSNNIINVKTYLRVCMYDYVVDESNNVVRGSNQFKIDIEYIIDWVREKDIGKLEKCPNCGAEINAIASGVCGYCRTKFVLPAKDYVMSRKTSVGQRRKQ